MATDSSQTDGLMDRAYRRFGWLVFPAFFVVLWFTGFGFWLLAIAMCSRLLELTADESRELMGWAFVLALVAVSPPVAYCIYLCRGLRQFDRGVLNGEQTWRAAVGMPLKSMKFGYAWFAVAVIPGVMLVFRQVVLLDWQIVGILGFVAAGIGLYILALGMFLFPVVLRPMLRAVGRRIDGPPPPVSGTSLKKRLLFVTPGLSVAMAMVGCGVAFTPGQDEGLAITQLALATVISAAATIPVTMLLEKAVRDPIDDLLAGTKRIRDADYGTLVPELSSDELAELARSFNSAMAGLAERQRLARENVRLLDEVRASRSRIVAASDASRQRVERNLHDGAQQRLVALALDLRMLEESLPNSSTEDAVNAVRQATNDVKEALAELRELARGLHPAVLATDGLSCALDQLATRAKVSVTVHATPERFPQAVEIAAYFVAAEALANVVKYAHASQVRVSAGVTGGNLMIEISDDGIGGATLGLGTGLAGLVDRVAALDGTLRLDSPVGQGTKVIAHIPVNGKAAVASSGIDVEGESPWLHAY